MTTITVKRPKERADILRLIRERDRHIAQLESVLSMHLPAQDRRHLQQRLHGEKMNRQSWIDYLNRPNPKMKTASKRSSKR